MPLIYHAESDFYAIGNLEDFVCSSEELNDVTGIPHHEAEAKKRGIVMTEIETGVAPPAPKTRKPRGRAAAKKEPPSAAIDIIKALQFVALAQKPQGVNYQTHCLINNHWAIGFDGQLMTGSKINADISACPHTANLLAALSKCGQQVAISQLSEGVLSVRSDKFKAAVDCISFESMPPIVPDPRLGPITDAIKEAFAALAWLAKEEDTKAHYASLLLRENTVVATNGSVILEYWHGLNIPCYLLIPKASALAISKVNKKLVSMGFSNSSATFYFEDESFIRTSIFVDRYPAYERIFEEGDSASVVPMPPDFYKAIEAVSGFAESKFVYLRGDKVQSHIEAERGATYDIEGVPDGMSFDFAWLKAIEPYFKNTKFLQHKAFFNNGSVRGAIMGGSHFTE